MEKCSVGPDWLLVWSKLVLGWTNDLPVLTDKNYVQACNSVRTTDYLSCHSAGHIFQHNPLTRFAFSLAIAHSLPMFREKRFKNKKKVKEADRKDPVKSHRPDLPVTGPGERFVWLFLTS